MSFTISMRAPDAAPAGRIRSAAISTALQFGFFLIHALCALVLATLVPGVARSAPAPLEIPATVAAVYAAIAAGDANSAAALLAPDAVWSYRAPEYAAPYAGQFRGPRGLADFLSLRSEALAESRFEPRDVWIDGDKVAVVGVESGEVRTTGGRYRVESLHVFTLRGGLIAAFDGFSNSAEVLEAFTVADAQRGRALYTTCATCHGSRALGISELSAPNLTGLGAAYLVRQLRNFRDGRRGSSQDSHGFMMIGRANSMPGDRGLRDVAAYVATLPVVRAAAALAGNAARGQKYFSLCESCHGDQAQGNEPQGTPPLWQLDDRYLLRQLEHFGAGIRGAQPADVPGGTMRAAIGALKGRNWQRDVVAYIKTRRVGAAAEERPN